MEGLCATISRGIGGSQVDVNRQVARYLWRKIVSGRKFLLLIAWPRGPPASAHRHHPAARVTRPIIFAKRAQKTPIPITFSHPLTPPAHLAMSLSIGVELSAVRDLPRTLDAIVASGFEFAAVPLFHPRGRRDRAGLAAAAAPGSAVPSREEPATREYPWVRRCETAR